MAILDVVAGLKRKYAEIDLCAADLAVVVHAGRLNSRRVLTFDDRRFPSSATAQRGRASSCSPSMTGPTGSR
jgi:hypothetical protein